MKEEKLKFTTLCNLPLLTLFESTGLKEYMIEMTHQGFHVTPVLFKERINPFQGVIYITQEGAFKRG